MKTSERQFLTGLALLTLVSGCGKATSDGSGVLGEAKPADSREEQDHSIDGLYMARFETLNPHVNGTIPGSLTFFRKGDRLMTYVRLFAGGPKVWHQQGVYTGTRCPTLSDDLNADGFIDIDEGMKVFGKMIIPLDANINSQGAGKNFYPLADLSGYYHYERIGSFERLFQDLYDEDKNLEDHIVKLAAGEPFTFEGKVVIVQGVAESTPLPSSIAVQERRRPFQTLPITCGIIRKVKEEPGTLDDGRIPGPIAPVEEGQDRPAPPEEEDETSGGTASGTTGTNDTNDGDMSDGEEEETSGSTGGASGGTLGGTTGETSGESSGGSSGDSDREEDSSSDEETEGPETNTES